MFLPRLIFHHFEEAICCVCLTSIAFCVMAQILARYVFQVALHWTEEVAAMSMVWAVYMGASLCVRERYHIRIVVAVQLLPHRMGLLIVFIADILWAAFSIMMMRISWDYLLTFWKYTSLSPSLGIDQFYPQSILFIGYGLMLVRLVETYVNWFREGRVGLPGMLQEQWEEDLEISERRETKH